MTILLSDIAISLALIIACILMLLGQNYESIQVIFSGCITTLICMGLYFFGLGNQPSKKLKLIKLVAGLAFAGLVFYDQVLVFYLPALLYSLNLDWRDQVWLLAAFLVYGLTLNLDIFNTLGLILLSALAGLTQNLIRRYVALQEDSYLQIDQLRHLNQQIQQEQRALIELQDEAIRESRDKERQRITSEIHDSLGHDLSASIIQLASMEYLLEDQTAKEQIQTIRNLLSSAMDDVRSAIHNEHQEALDLADELSKQVQAFSKCPISFNYAIKTEPSIQVKHSMISILKEALTNINKHSTASQVRVSFSEGEKDWMILITDDGKNIQLDQSKSGLGLVNMEKRVQSFRGSLHINTDKGFRIFIRLPKEGNQ